MLPACTCSLALPLKLQPLAHLLALSHLTGSPLAHRRATKTQPRSWLRVGSMSTHTPTNKKWHLLNMAVTSLWSRGFVLREALALMYGAVHALFSLSLAPSLVNMQVPGEEQMARPSSPPAGGRRRTPPAALCAGKQKHSAANKTGLLTRTHSPGTLINAINNVKNVPYHQPIPTR